ncbi:MAG: tRNA pseudouridine(55) synthase [Bacteroidales bacterium]|nr:tRNA pseudouridine(55) synthase [Bacteroidales bacterium]
MYTIADKSLTFLSGCIDDYPEGIVIPVDKPYRWTSADVIRKLKYAAFRKFSKKNLKVGHAGTLDPLATGVLLVCIGNACKRAQELQDHDKEYIADVTFGATTPSYDLEKEIDRKYPYEHITENSVRDVLARFSGEQDQVAPLFSAKSVDGVRAYELARKLYKEGKELDDTGLISTSRITIHELELLDFGIGLEPWVQSLDCGACGEDWTGGRVNAVAYDQSSKGVAGIGPGKEETASSRINVAENSGLTLPTARIRVVCSKGTYIRALARDLGEALESGAHLTGLIRSRSGQFEVSKSNSLDSALHLLGI